MVGKWQLFNDALKGIMTEKPDATPVELQLGVLESLGFSSRSLKTFGSILNGFRKDLTIDPEEIDRLKELASRKRNQRMVGKPPSTARMIEAARAVDKRIRDERASAAVSSAPPNRSQFVALVAKELGISDESLDYLLRTRRAESGIRVWRGIVDVYPYTKGAASKSMSKTSYEMMVSAFREAEKWERRFRREHREMPPVAAIQDEVAKRLPGGLTLRNALNRAASSGFDTRHLYEKIARWDFPPGFYK